MTDTILAAISEKQAAIRPDSIACQFGDRKLTFRDLDANANKVAQGLIAARCRPGARIAILAKNSGTFLEILFGAMKAGVVTLTVNWRLAGPEVSYILEHAKAEFLFFDAEFAGIAASAQTSLGGAGTLVSMGEKTRGAELYETWRDANPALRPDIAHDTDDVVLQMYTSGTTGSPKGVQLTNRNYFQSMAISSQLPWQDYSSADIMFAPAPFFHVNGINASIRSLHIGARLLTIDQFRPAEVVAMFEREKVTRATLAPAMLQMCLEVPGVESMDFSSLKVITYGGSPIAERVLLRAKEVFGCSFAQGYGMTEATGAIAMLSPDDHADGRGKLLSCGRPLPGLDVRVVDASGAICPPRQVGEVVVRGPVVTKGYWRDEKSTANAIVDGYLHTGDAAYFDEDGYLYIHDRLKEMIISGGENIYPAEVENALFHHPALADVAVIGVPDAKWGEAVKAVVVLKPGASASEEELIRHARGHIAGYKVPKSIDFVNNIPRNAAGKILKRELRSLYWGSGGRNVN